MLILGGTIYHDFRQESQGNRKIYSKEVIRFVVVENFLFPVIFLVLLTWMQPDYSVALIIILEAAVPPVTAIPIFAERSGGNKALVQ